MFWFDRQDDRAVFVLPWERPLNVKLPEPVTCIGCGRHQRQLAEAGTRFITQSEFLGIGLCWACVHDEGHDYSSEWREALTSLRAAGREVDQHDAPASGCGANETPAPLARASC